MTTSTRVLAVAFVAVVAAFIGSSVLVRRSARVIDADALRISRDAAPGIQWSAISARSFGSSSAGDAYHR